MLLQKRPTTRNKKISNKHPNFALNRTRKRTTNKAQSEKKVIIKIRAEINKIGSKRTIQKINETKSWFKR